MRHRSSDNPRGVHRAVPTPGSSMNRAALLSAQKAVLPAAFAFIFLASSTTLLHADAASKLYKHGQAAEAAENYDLAYDDYKQALQKKPSDLRYKAALARIRLTAASVHLAKGRQLEQAGQDEAALVELLRAADMDPSNESVTQEIAAVRRHEAAVAAGAPPPPPPTVRQQEIQSIGSPIDLKPSSSEPQTLRMSADAKTIYTAIGRAAGINVIFDSGWTSTNIQVDLTNVSFLDALRIVGIQTNTFWRAVTPNTIFVAQNTRRRDLEEQAVQVFYLSNAFKDNDLNDTSQAVRNVLGTGVKVNIVASQKAIIVRGSPDELLLAGKIIGDLDKAVPEVVVDIAIMEVSKDWERTLGLAWPGSVGVTLEPPTTTSSTTTTTTSTTSSNNGLTLYNLANLNSNDFAITVGSATANLLLSDSNTKVLDNPRLRATNNEKATMKIGEKIPYATGTFNSGVSSALSVGVAQTQFQYQDIGVQVEMTPTIHNDGDVTLKLKVEDTSEGTPVTISGVSEPVVIQKTSEQTIRLREGQVSILGGILEQSDTSSWTGIPGLSSIPILRYLFGSKDHTILTDELVFMVVPHIVRGADYTDDNLRAVDVGAGQNIQLRRLPINGPAANSGASVQTGVATTSYGTYVAPSAAAAAPTALADLRNSANGAMESAAPIGGPKSPASTRAAAQAPPAVPANTPAGVAATAPQAPGSGMRFMLSAPGSVTSGSTFQVPVVVSGAADISSIPLQLHYDASKLSLVNVSPGDFLARDGQAVQPVHRDDGPGDVTINASRPTGVAGVSGAGVVYVLSFQAKSAGSSTIAITRPGALNSHQQPVPAQAGAATVTVK